MGIIGELNLRPFRTYFQMGGKSEGIIPVTMVQDYFQCSIKLLEIESMVDRKIAASYPSSVQAMIAGRVLDREGTGKAKIPDDITLEWQKKET